MTYGPVSGMELGSQLLDVLLLPKHTRWFELRCGVDGIANITCEYFVSIESVKGLKAVLQKYQLVKVPEDKPPQQEDVIDRLTKYNARFNR